MSKLAVTIRNKLARVLLLYLVSFPTLAAISLSTLQLIDSSSLSISYGNAVTNRATNQTTYTATLKNDSTQSIVGPIYLAISGITPSGIVVSNASGVSEEGIPYLLINTSALGPGQTTTANIVFSNPSRTRFSFIGKTYHANNISVSISSPLPGETVDADSVIVNGTFQGPANTGITINRQIAVTQGNSYYATVPLALGENTLTVEATSPDGQTTADTLSVISSGVSPISVEVAPSAGIAPLVVNFKIINNTQHKLQTITVDYDGDGTDDFTTSDSNAAFAFTYTTARAYQAVFDALDEHGTSYTTKAQIIVKDATQIDTVLNSVWNGMRTALASNDPNKALDFLNQQAKEKYAPVFNKLASQMPAIVSTFSPLKRVSISDHIGEYAVSYTLNKVNWIFLIYFLQDDNGVWRLDSM